MLMNLAETFTSLISVHGTLSPVLLCSGVQCKIAALTALFSNVYL